MRGRRPSPTVPTTRRAPSKRSAKSRPRCHTGKHAADLGGSSCSGLFAQRRWAASCRRLPSASVERTQLWGADRTHRWAHSTAARFDGHRESGFSRTRTGGILGRLRAGPECRSRTPLPCTYFGDLITPAQRPGCPRTSPARRFATCPRPPAERHGEAARAPSRRCRRSPTWTPMTTPSIPTADTCRPRPQCRDPRSFQSARGVRKSSGRRVQRSHLDRRARQLGTCSGGRKPPHQRGCGRAGPNGVRRRAGPASFQQRVLSATQVALEPLGNGDRMAHDNTAQKYSPHAVVSTRAASYLSSTRKGTSGYSWWSGEVHLNSNSRISLDLSIELWRQSTIGSRRLVGELIGPTSRQLGLLQGFLTDPAVGQLYHREVGL